MFLIQKIKAFAIAHKIVSTCMAIVIVFGTYSVVKSIGGKDTSTQYAIAAVTKGTVISTINSSGQVSASNQVDLKSKASGNLSSLNIVAGQEVKAGQLMAKVDTRNAAISLESARISLSKLTEPADASTVLQSKNALDSATQSLEDSKANLAKYYLDALNEVASTFVDIPGIMDGLNSMFYVSSGFLSDNKTIFLEGDVKADKIAAGAKYDVAKKFYADLLPVYKNVSRASATSSIESLIAGTYDLAVKTADAVKDAKNTVDYIKSNHLEQSSTEATTAQTSLNTWTSQVATHLSNLQSVKSQIESEKNNMISLVRDIEQKRIAYEELLKGPDALDVKSQELSLQQQQYNYDDYFIRAPFDGVIASVAVKKTDSVSSGTVIGTLISKQQIAELSLNEVDAAKVAVGQKVTVTFDAIPDLSISGQVAEVDLLGTVTQGVVTYNVKIAFDTQDSRIKPGMSLNAS